MTEEEKEKCEPRTRQIKSVTHCFDIVLEFSQCVLQFMFPAGQFLLGLRLEGRDGWDQGTTGTDRYIGSFGGPQPAVSGAEIPITSKSQLSSLFPTILQPLV